MQRVCVVVYVEDAEYRIHDSCKEKNKNKMGLLDKIKQESKKSGQSKGKFIYFRENEKKNLLSQFLSSCTIMIKPLLRFL